MKSTSYPRIDCHRCRHYFVTWDARFPHGCRAMGFHCKVLPMAEVRKVSACTCLLYAPRMRRKMAGGGGERACGRSSSA